MRAVLVLALAVFVAVPAAPAAAARTKGKSFLPSHGNAKMPVKRAKRAARKVIRAFYEVRKGTDIYACDRTATNTAACVFAFLSKDDKYTCGNARLRANKTRIVVRYVAETGGCGDF